jgi:hypothetical protein
MRALQWLEAEVAVRRIVAAGLLMTALAILELP